MDPVSLIVTALATGAASGVQDGASGVQDGASGAVKGAYWRLPRAIRTACK